jgi:flagellin
MIIYENLPIFDDIKNKKVFDGGEFPLRLNSQFENKFFENRRLKIANKIQKSTRNISSGLKVQGAGDDPAGLAVSETIRAQIRGLAQSQRNVQDGIALLKTNEDGIMKTNEDVQRLYELSVMASNDTMDDESRGELQAEVDHILSSIQQTAETVQFNTRNLFVQNNTPNSLTLQQGSSPKDTMTVKLVDISVKQLGLENASVTTLENANKLLQTSKNVIGTLTEHLTKIGAQYAALEHNLENSLNLQNNLTTIESNIRDSNIGKEVINLTISKLLSEALNTLHIYSDDQKQHFEKILFN